MSTSHPVRTASGPAAPAAPAAPADRDRGDVPGWVLVTVMTAGIVVALGGVAVPALTEMFQTAIGAVTLP